MTYAGARTETEQQIASTLHFTLPQERLHPTFNFLDLTLASRSQESAGNDGRGFRLNIANSIWGQKGYAFLMGYLDVLAQNYGAGLRLLDFIQAPEESRATINKWVSDQTEDKIKDLIPPGKITDLTRLILVNAIYFNAAWASPFSKELTKEESFYLADGGVVTVPMMAQTNYFGYSEGDDYQAVELRYGGWKLSMVVLLPQTGRFSDFEKSFSVNRLNAMLNNIKGINVRLKLPRFSYSGYSFSLKDVFSGMGMALAFSNYADFSGMDGTRKLRIDDVVHKAFVAVDEAGTEAAAATAVIIGVTGIPQEPVTMTVNRPFIFLIRDVETGAILFIGRIMNPAS